MRLLRDAIAAWCRRWFRSASLLDLGVSRVVLVSIVLYMNGTMRFLGVGLVSPELWRPLPWIEALGFGQRPTLAELMLYGRATQIALVAAGLGVFTNLALAIAFLLQLLQEGFLNCFGKMNHATMPLLYAMLFFALAPCGRSLSVDALAARWWRRRRRRSSVRRAARSHDAAWPLELLFVELATYYFLAGFSKLKSSGVLWADGYTLQYYLLEKATPAGLWLAERPLLCGAFSVLVLAFELSWPLAVVFVRLRPAFFAAGLAFHLGTIVFLRISFWPVWVLYALFVPWSRLIVALRGLRQPVEVVAAGALGGVWSAARSRPASAARKRS